MLKLCCLLILSSIGLISQSCSSAPPQNLNAEISNEISPTPTQTPKSENIPQSAKVEFEGVNFTYNPQIFGDVKSDEAVEYFLQEETDKPDGVEPQHRLFTFDFPVTDYGPMYISVYPINDFPRMYAVNKSSVKAMQKEINDFKKVLKDNSFRDEYNQIPYLPFIDAGQTFQVKVKHFDFSSGKGILFLTFWETQIEFPSNRQLRYVYEGLTKDGKYYVLAEMPTKVTFLPDDVSQEYEGYKIPSGEKFNFANVEKKIKDVDKKIANRLENLPQNEFEPNLDEFEKIISSLKIEK